jgi:serine/threonine-protein kinase
MQGPTEFSALRDWSAVPNDSAEKIGLLSQRVGYFGRVMALLSAAFLLFNNVVHRLSQGSWARWAEFPGEALHAGAVAVFALMWLVCRKGRRSAQLLHALDVGGLVASVALFAWKGTIDDGGFLQATVTAMTSLAVIVTHAIIVPATARRAFGVSLVASIPSTIAAYVICRRLSEASGEVSVWMVALGTLYIGMWSALTVAVATLASRVIYGLRERAREAREIGQYTLEARLGAGGMGVVYLARHSLLRRPTALKLLPRERAGERRIQRFEREVQLTSSLTHPNTVAVYDFGRTPDGIFYYVMEYIDGVTLEDLVQHGGPLPPGRVIHLLEQLCGALIEAHSVGLVHRDIKPQNLMLCVRGKVSDHLKVLDFGLVKDRSESAPNATDEGAFVGTPLYMAPETVLNPASVGPAADIYSVGAVAYFLLCGEPVFTGTLMEVCLKHVHEDPVPAASRAPQAVPPELDQLVLACLKKKPHERPASAAALREALGALRATATWTAADADAWWLSAAPATLAASRTRQTPAPQSPPGPQTLAIDWAARQALTG